MPAEQLDVNPAEAGRLLGAVAELGRLIALLPVLTSTGKGSDIMVPMAIPVFGGMVIQVITLFVVPVLYAAWKEGKLALGIEDRHWAAGEAK